MARHLALLVVWGSTAAIVLSIIGALYLLVDIEAFASLASITWRSLSTGTPFPMRSGTVPGLSPRCTSH